MTDDKNKQDLTEYHDAFVSAAKLQGDATKTGDSRTANRQYTILKRIFIKAQKNIDGAKIFYKTLRNNSEPNARLWACAHSLALGIDVSEAEKGLNIFISK